MADKYREWLSRHPELDKGKLGGLIQGGFDVIRLEFGSDEFLVLVWASDAPQIAEVRERDLRDAALARSSLEFEIGKLRQEIENAKAQSNDDGLEPGQKEYELKAAGQPWRKISPKTNPGVPFRAAKAYAKKHGKPWPLSAPSKAVE